MDFVQISHSVMSDSLRPHGLQHARLPCPSPTPGACPNSCPSSRLCHSPSHPLLSPSPSAFGLAQHQGLFKWVSFSHQVGKVLEFELFLASASVLPMNIQDWFPLTWTSWISLLSKGLSESSPTPQFKSINSSALSFLYGLTLTSIHDYWKNHRFD